MKNFVINFLKGVGIIIITLYVGFSFLVVVYAFYGGTFGNLLTISLLPGTCWWLWWGFHRISELGKNLELNPVPNTYKKRAKGNWTVGKSHKNDSSERGYAKTEIKLPLGDSPRGFLFYT